MLSFSLICRAFILERDKCFEGYFKNGEFCEPCDSSCKQCNRSDQCTKCEDYMYLNQTTLLCESCPQGYYYDIVTEICRDCSGSCNGACKIQQSCLDCPEGAVLELDNLQCVDPYHYMDDKPFSKGAILQSPELNLSPVIRNFKEEYTIEYYIDIYSEQPLELGTLEYPYRSFKAVSYEILTFYSHTNISVVIYTKDAYIKDDTNIYVNMTSVTVLPHPQWKSVLSPPMLIPTQVPQTELPSKTLFHLLRSTKLPIKTTISAGELSEYEVALLEIGKITILPIQTSFTMKDINIYREEKTPDLSFYLIYCGNLNSKTLHIENVNLNITGSFVQTNRPLNAVIKSVKADLVRLKDFYDASLENCNYPEANLTTTLVFDNFSFVNSNISNGRAPQSIINLSGPENITATNIDCRNWFTLRFSDHRCFAYRTIPNCIPQDSLLQQITAVRVANDLIADSSKYYVANVITTDIPHYRNIHQHIEKYTADNLVINSFKIYFSSLSSIMDSWVFKDAIFTNCTSTSPFVSTRFANWAINENITFTNIPKCSGSLIESIGAIDVTLKNIYIQNYTSDKAGSFPAIDIRSLSDSTTIIQNISARDCFLYGNSLISQMNNLKEIRIQDGYYHNIRLKTSAALLHLYDGDDFLISNQTIVSSHSLNQNEKSTFLEIFVINVPESNHSVIEDIVFEDSSLGVIKIGSLRGSTDQVKTFTLNQVRYLDCYIFHSDSLISTGGMISSSLYEIRMNSIAFENVSYYSWGDLINLRHQLSIPAIVTNLTLIEVKSAGINAESFNSYLPGLKTSVTFEDVYVRNASVTKTPLIRTDFDSMLKFINVSFSNIQSTYLDSGIFNSEHNSLIVIQNALFKDNLAISSCVFKVKDNSEVQCTNCTMTHNFAVSSGVVSTESNGKFEFVSSQIYLNYAIQNSIGLLYGLGKASVFSNCEIYQNEVLDISELLLELTNCSKFCHMNDNFKEYLTTLDQSSITMSQAAVQVLFGSLDISNETEIYYQQEFISASDSLITISNSTISHTKILYYQSVGYNSKFIFRDVQIINVTQPNNDRGLILALSGSEFEASNLTFKNSNTHLFLIQDSSAQLEQIHFENIHNANFLLDFIRSTWVCLKDIKVPSEIDITEQYFHFKDSERIELINIIASGLKIPLIKAENSHFNLIYNLRISNSLKIIEFNDSDITNMTQCYFGNNGDESILVGGALTLYNSVINIESSSFINNSAISGGAISFQCPSAKRCKLQMMNSTFSNNSAVSKGGAIYYDYNPPLLSGVVFNNNSAPYGDNLASYPYCIGFEGFQCDQCEPLSNLTSGIQSETPLKLAIYDHEHQIVSLVNSSQLIITSMDTNLGQVAGDNNAIINDGVATFSDIRFISQPGSNSVGFKISSIILNKKKLLAVYNKTTTVKKCNTNFRYCQPGERQYKNKCEICSAGTFSLKWSSTECEKCIGNAVCRGGAELSVRRGYWRRTSNSTTIIRCLNEDACEGGYAKNPYYPTNCKEGYEGPLCSKCRIIGDVKYQRQNEFGCAKCPSVEFTAVLMIFKVILAIAYFMIIIGINVRKTKESELSVLLRIFTNYIQLIMALLSMSTNFPKLDSYFATSIDIIGGSSTLLLSFDCLISEYEITGPFRSNAVLKLFLLAILPLLIFAPISIFWIILHRVSKNYVRNLTKNLIVTFISIIFLLHPRLTQESINIWRCMEIDNGVKVARFDMDIQCYSMTHLKYCLLISAPILIIWVITMPMIPFIILCTKRAKEEDQKAKEYLLILHQGLKDKCIYWEFVKTFRKFLLATCLLLNEKARLSVASVLLIVSSRIQLWLKPYKYDKNNEIEYLEILCGAFVGMAGYVFTMDNQVEGLNALTVLFVIAINFVFILHWLYLLCFNYQEKHCILSLLSRIFGCLLCIKSKKDQENKNLSDPRILESPKIPIIPCNKNKKKQRKLRRVKRRCKKKSSKFNSKLPKLTIPKKQLHPKPWDSFSSYSPSDPFHAPTTTPFKPSTQSQTRPPAITHINFNLPPQSPPKRILHPLNPSSNLNPHKSLCPSPNT
ncbi:unnamed protein product [Moneuplotes crassus]|uniref:TNFR-Cys domain-containing protein n=1 Tax=Euplotes crassus TaxID=5936 RepID=A0AAD1XHK2_EUPCR|nr:unnamed protein product [Moneuplotes crassus]